MRTHRQRAARVRALEKETSAVHIACKSAIRGKRSNDLIDGVVGEIEAEEARPKQVYAYLSPVGSAAGNLEYCGMFRQRGATACSVNSTRFRRTDITKTLAARLSPRGTTSAPGRTSTCRAVFPRAPDL